MKLKSLHNLISICIAFLLLFVTFGGGTFATFAEETGSAGLRYNVVTVVVDGKPVGVRMYGSYFGIGAADVSVEVYDNVNFHWNSPQTAEQLQTKQRLTALFDEISQLCGKINELSNVLYDGADGVVSDIWRYNNAQRGERIQIDKLTYEMLTVAAEMYRFTDGLFNPALNRLVDLWGFSPRFSDGVYAQSRYAQSYDRVYDYTLGSYPLPEDKYVQVFSDSKFTDFSKVSFENIDGKYFVTKSDVVATVDGVEYTQWLDVGGIAKGFACDEIVKLFSENNIYGYYVDVGGSSAACGSNYDGGSHMVAVTDPFKSVDDIASVAVADKALSTSGVYRRYYTVDGQRYCHVIDDRSGKPVEGIAYSATVVSDCFSAAQADCITTALLLLDGDGIAKFVNDNPDVCVLVAARTTSGNKQLLTNVDIDKLTKGNTLDGYAYALTEVDGSFVYDSSAEVNMGGLNKTTVVALLCTAFGILVCVSVTLCVVVKNKNKSNTVVFKQEPPFRKGDVAVYFAIATLVVTLFVAFAVSPTKDKTIAFVKAVDMTDGETVFSYDVARNTWIADSDNWVANVQENGQKITVTLYRTDDESRFNVFEIDRANGVSVKMTNAVCGAHKDCVNNFGAIDANDQSIVCSPNGLKVVSE